ncbi:radical SAM protein [Tunturiibacter empetritectus]|uniref:DNA repair photolyase n=1 Tax=Tunturiibacter lichenicola TaxID=2051959 RepID=A0A852VAV2_9BACT|nr:radical SAM protein [Edaphobacter lichenicola]NYF88820.1 DNA repair photolyase [Edaphobacter lichenicola]
MEKQDSTSLFPILPPSPVGIARMAAEAEHAEDGHLIEFKMLKVRSILNKSVSKRQLSLAYSINPYRGCEFGCKYCYARYTHEFMAPKAAAEISAEVTTNTIDMRDPLSFERMIFLKQNAAWLLEQELKKIDPADEVALGTATDPYQPIERRAKITRSILEVFSRKEGYRLGIVTKSRLIERDIDLLVEIGRHNTLVVHVTITTPDAKLARLLEPRAPRPDLRFQAVRRMREAGIIAGVFGSPLLPGITDNEEALDGMAQRSAAVGASFFAAHPLFLKPCSRPTYLSFVREHFPALQADYAKRFATADFAGREYRERLAKMVDSACRRYGLGKRSSDALLTRNEEGGGKRPTLGVGTTARQQRLFA